jgi:hypothetical protein
MQQPYLMKKLTEETPDQKNTSPFAAMLTISQTALKEPLSVVEASIPHLLVALPYRPNTTTAITPDPAAGELVT